MNSQVCMCMLWKDFPVGLSEGLAPLKRNLINKQWPASCNPAQSHWMRPRKLRKIQSTLFGECKITSMWSGKWKQHELATSPSLLQVVNYLNLFPNNRENCHVISDCIISSSLHNELTWTEMFIIFMVQNAFSITCNLYPNKKNLLQINTSTIKILG